MNQEYKKKIRPEKHCLWYKSNNLVVNNVKSEICEKNYRQMIFTVRHDVFSFQIWCFQYLVVLHVVSKRESDKTTVYTNGSSNNVYTKPIRFLNFYNDNILFYIKNNLRP